jgi:hypothetical protein
VKGDAIKWMLKPTERRVLGGRLTKTKRACDTLPGDPVASSKNTV